MSFFGFDDNNDTLEEEKEKFMRGGLEAEEGLAVYNWGESDYDGLGEALQEGGDELNDETFGVGPVGKDFDFGKTELPESKIEKPKTESRREYQDSLLHGKPSRVTPVSVESIWDDKSATSVLTSARTTGRVGANDHATASSHVSRAPSLTPHNSQPSVSSQSTVRTLQEIEAEMRAKQYQSQSLQLRHQQILRNEQIGQRYSQQQSYQQQIQQQHLKQQRQLEQQHLEQQHLEQQRQLEQQQLLQRQLEQQQIQEQLERRHLLEQRHLLQQQLHQQLEHEQLQLQKQHIALQQQQPLLGSVPHSRQQNLRTPDRFNQQAQLRKSFPNTPEPQFPAQLAYGTSEQQAQIHMQQQLLLQLSRAGVAPDQMHLLDPLQREAIMNEARRKILAAEKLDQRNRRRLVKMERMARYNDLMTQSDKDFITRIQVSQLVTADPYVEDFYAQVLNSLRRNGPGMRFGNTGVSTHRLGGRREHAMNRMAEQVYRIVENAKAREKEKDQNGLNPLQGVLGKTSGRSYKAAPRQLLQVNSSQTAGSPTSSPQLHEAETVESPSDAKEEQEEGPIEKPPPWPVSHPIACEPLTRRQALAIIETLFDHALNWENNRRFIPEDNPEAFERWQAGQKVLEAKMWEGSQVTAPLEARHPHPLVSILTPLKGMKVMKRLTRVMDARQLRITMTLIIRLFADFDVIQNYHISESLTESKERNEMERHIHVFEEFVLEAILPALAVAPLPVVSGQLQLLRNPVQVARTRPGIILLTNIFTRAAIIKDRTLTLQSGGNVENPDDVATPEEFYEWQNQYDQLFEVLAPHFLSFFPSTRVLASLPFGMEHQFQTTLALDAADEPVWSFFASMAVPALSEQQQILVTQLREKVLENVLSAQQGWVTDENERTLKLRNVNMFLHALGLDSSQINL
ncbi:topoisomerase II-associated protein PAT1 [Hysterangium stoloniferum]|nr:topoisomerase II-associated protein PAT1 [Hysterangium stoloniferum]